MQSPVRSAARGAVTTIDSRSLRSLVGPASVHIRDRRARTVPTLAAREVDTFMDDEGPITESLTAALIVDEYRPRDMAGTDQPTTAFSWETAHPRRSQATGTHPRLPGSMPPAAITCSHRRPSKPPSPTTSRIRGSPPPHVCVINVEENSCESCASGGAARSRPPSPTLGGNDAASARRHRSVECHRDPLDSPPRNCHRLFHIMEYHSTMWHAVSRGDPAEVSRGPESRTDASRQPPQRRPGRAGTTADCSLAAQQGSGRCRRRAASGYAAPPLVVGVGRLDRFAKETVHRGRHR